MLLTCDCGRSEVFSHRLPKNGASFDAQQDTFLKIPRPTDADVDASGRLFVTSWKSGQFAYDGPNIGFVTMITPSNFVAHPAPRLLSLNDAELIQELRSPSDALRLAVQNRLLRPRIVPQVAADPVLIQRFLQHREDRWEQYPRPRGITLKINYSVHEALVELAKNQSVPLSSRVAAVWTLRQRGISGFKVAFGSLLIDPDLREHVIRAAADRKTQIDKGLIAPIYSKLDDSNPKVRAAAIVAMGRMGETRAAKQLLRLTSNDSPPSVTGTVTIDGKPANGVVVQFSNSGGNSAAKTAADGTYSLKAVPGEFTVSITTPKENEAANNSVDAWRNADPDRVIPHLAVNALVELNAIDPCLEALNGPNRAGALAALKHMHDPKTVDGLFKMLSTSRDEALRREVWTSLIRLYHREGEFTVDSPKWWGTRPDTTGPYYDRQKWSESDRIADAIRIAMTEGNESLKTHITEQLKKHVVNLDGISAAEIAMAEPDKAIVLPKADPNDPNAIANLAVDVATQRATAASGDTEKGKLLFKQQNCINCHTFANGQQPKGPHLVDIGKRYKRAELIESILAPGKKIAQGFDTWAFAMDDGKVYTGFVALESAETVTVRDVSGVSRELHQQNIEERVKQEISMMPLGIVGNLSPEQLADLIAYLESLH
ncbi:MAG: HEAT repeat domain-containing protein, partial [Planctomycetota bacterium]|nr:HEAT repeat domain-containing protein [Planctomycetota bacterium]